MTTIEVLEPMTQGWSLYVFPDRRAYLARAGVGRAPSRKRLIPWMLGRDLVDAGLVVAASAPPANRFVISDLGREHLANAQTQAFEGMTTNEPKQPKRRARRGRELCAA